MSDEFVTVDAPKKASGVSVAALICGIVGVCCCNPFYLMNLAAVVLGIIGIATAKDRPKGMAIAGLILGISGVLVQIIGDLVITICSFGTGFFSFFI